MYILQLKKSWCKRGSGKASLQNDCILFACHMLVSIPNALCDFGISCPKEQQQKVTMVPRSHNKVTWRYTSVPTVPTGRVRYYLICDNTYSNILV
jgi:hypothetical protein